MSEIAERFRALHERMLVMPNPWDAGSARLLESLGFDALATTSSGFAATLGRLDYGVTREEALAHAAAIVAATDLPVSADLENGWDDPAETVRGAVAAGLAGCSIEDSTGDRFDPIFEPGRAAERIAAAAEAAGGEIVLTARAENFLHDRRNLDDTIVRLIAYAQAGADVLFAPGLRRSQDIQAVVDAVAPTPVNVIALPGVPSVAELEQIGVRRVSVGGAFAFAAANAMVAAATELREEGTYTYWDQAGPGSAAVKRAFG